MNRLIRLFLIASFLGLLSGCVLPNSVPPPTPLSADYLPTVIALTAHSAMSTMFAETPSVVPSITPSPTLTLIPSDTPTPVPTDTPTPSPVAPGAQIQIHAPGPMSKVVSPIELRMTVAAGLSESVQVDLYGEDGRLLARTVEYVPSRPSGYFVSLKVPFEVRAVAEVGRLTVSTQDEYGRLQALTSMNLWLLSVGTAEITPAGDLSERLVIYSPQPQDVVSGGVLTVSGRFQPFNDQPVIMELVDPAGKSVGLRVLDVHGTDPQLFDTTIPYKVSDVTQARLVLRQDDDRMSGLFYLYSQEITLNP